MRIDYGLKCILEQFEVYIPRRGIQTRVYLGATVDHENEAGDAGGWKRACRRIADLFAELFFPKESR